MKSKTAVLFVSAMLFGSGLVHDACAQSNAAMLSLLISTSPEANAMGETYGNTFRTSPMGSLYNPAGAGLFAEDHFFAYASYPDKTAWLPDMVSDMSLDAESMAFGVNLARFTRIPVSVGLSVNRMKFDMGWQGLDADETFNSWEKMKGTTLGIAWSRSVRIAAGVTWKNVESRLAPMGAGDGAPASSEAEADLRDYGFIVEVPFMDLVRGQNSAGSNTGRCWVPFLDAGFHAAEANVGGKVHFADADQEDLLPRRLSVGLQWHAGLRYRGNRDHFNILSFRWAREVDDELIRRKEDFSSEYTSLFKDIKPWEHLVVGHPDESVIIKNGYEASLADFCFIRAGRYEDKGGQVVFTTKGWGIDYTQPFRILSELMGWNDHLAMRLITCIRFETHYAEYHSRYSILDGTEFKTHTVRLNNFPIGDIF